MERPTPCPAHHADHKAGCPDCRTYARNYRTYRLTHIANGTWDVSRVPVEPVRAHVRSLINNKMTIASIVKRSGVAGGTLNRILYVYNVKTCRRTHADALLAVQHDPAGQRNMCGVGTRRRIRALMAMGWDQGTIAARLGVGNTVVSEWAVLPDGGRVFPESAEIVRILYDRLHAVDGPKDRVRRWADRRGWDPPEAWSDDTIDDPAAEPYSWCRNIVDEVAVQRALQGEMRWGQLTDPERVEVVRRLNAAGRGLSRLRTLTEVSTSVYYSWCRRTGYQPPARDAGKVAA